MRLADAYPVIVTTRLTECRDFYTRWLGFQILFEASWFVYLASAGDVVEQIEPAPGFWDPYMRG